MLCKKYSFLVTDTTLLSEDPLRFRKNLLKEVQTLVMKNYEKIRDEKFQFDISRSVAKISALTPGKIDKYEYQTGEDILTPQEHRILEQAKFAYSPLGKIF